MVLHAAAAVARHAPSLCLCLSASHTPHTHACLDDCFSCFAQTRQHPHPQHTHPQGADFGSQARKAIEHKLRKGMSIEEIEWRLKNPGQEYDKAAAATKAAAAAVQQAPPMVDQQPKEAPRKEDKKQQKQQQEQQVKEATPPPPPPPKAAAPPVPVEVGESMVSRKRDPLKLIKVR